MENEQLLTGGRVTEGVVRAGGTVRRPMPANAALQIDALGRLREVRIAPEYLGTDEKGRMILSYIEGECPPDLGTFAYYQTDVAFRMIRTVHETLGNICHGDLSPCNFVFRGDIPTAIIDWDAAHIGDIYTDLAYALWMWSDAGNEAVSHKEYKRRVRDMLRAYGPIRITPTELRYRMVREAMRVAQSVFPTVEQTRRTHDWAVKCAKWISEHPF